MGDWGNAAGGAASGAAAGAALGPYGAIAGGLIGGALGYFRHGESAGDAARRRALLGLGGAGAANYGRLGGALDAEAEYMRRIARGQESVSAEQLRQGLQQNLSAQQSMAASAAPQNAAMAGLQASRNAMSLGSGLAGQQAIAGIQERQAAQNALAQMLLRQREQELAAVNAGYGTGGATSPPSWLDQWGGAVKGVAGLYGLGGGGGGGGSAPQYRYGPQPGPNGTTTYVPPPPR